VTTAAAQRQRKYRKRKTAGMVESRSAGALTPERAQHNAFGLRAFSARAGDEGLKVLDQRWIDKYHLRGQLNDRQWEAASKLYQLWYAARIERAVVGDYEGGGSAQRGRKHGARPNDRVPNLSPLELMWRALGTIPAWQRAIVRTVAIDNRALTQAPRASLSHPIYGLQEALDGVADHFGL
jgi:hypothetical protein